MKIKLLISFFLIIAQCYGQKEKSENLKIKNIQTQLASLNRAKQKIIRLPVDKSKFKEFIITKNSFSSLPKSLQNKYDAIKSFSGTSLDGKSLVTLTSSKNKFFGTITNGAETYEIQTKNGFLKIKKSDFKLEDCADCKRKTCGEEPQTFLQKKSLKKQLFGAKMLAASGSRGDIKSTFPIVITTTGLENERRGITTK